MGMQATMHTSALVWHVDHEPLHLRAQAAAITTTVTRQKPCTDSIEGPHVQVQQQQLHHFAIGAAADDSGDYTTGALQHSLTTHVG